MLLIPMVTLLRTKPGLKTTLGARMDAFAREQLRLAEMHLALQGTERHEGVHQARKCVRRVRAILALASTALDPHADRIDDDLGQLCRGLSSLRDSQALIDAIVRFGSGAAGSTRKTLREAKAAALTYRDLTMDRALARDPEFASRRRRLLAIEKRIARLDWTAVRPRDLFKAMQRGERRLKKARRRARKHPDRDTNWHLYRRRLRRLKDQESILAELEPELHSPTHSHGQQQARILGESQDDVLVLRFCRRNSPFDVKQRALLCHTARSRMKSVRCD